MSSEEILQSVLSENDSLHRVIASLKAEMEAERCRRNVLQRENKNLTELLTTWLEEADKLKTVNTDLLLRLSKVAGDRLVEVENIPVITELSDRNRPTRLGEIYSEIYDNEWKDALDALQTEGYEEEFAISTLHLTLVNIFDFCKNKSERMLRKTEDDVDFLFEEYALVKETKNDIQLQERWKLQKTQHGNMQAHFIGTLKAYTRASWIDREFVPELKPFIRECIFLCWMMVVQSPPMSLHMIDANKDAKFDKALYKDYTRSGPQIQFVVWPALLLHENGAIISKGVAQGCDHT